MGLPGFNAESSVYRSSVHYVPALWTGSVVSSVVDFNTATLSVARRSISPFVPGSLPKCGPLQGDLCGFAGGPPYNSAYCCPSGYVCCNPSCSQGSSTCVGCCPQSDPQCCQQNGSGLPGGGPLPCPYPTTNCGLIPGPNGRFSCCPAGETCCNPTTHLCCGRLQACCGNKCCSPGLVCNDPTTGTCCLPGKACGSGCCGFNQQCCNGVCVDTSTDLSNCGTCENTCSPGEICQNGVCTCPPGQTDCGDGCSDPLTDRFNCGSCFNFCGTGGTCQNGVCICGPLQTKCGGNCTAILTDSSNCGGCGNVCPPGLVCSGGACVCPMGLTNCGGVCKNLVFDPLNCGACGKKCGFCCAGSCGMKCPTGGCCPDPMVCLNIGGTTYCLL